MNYLNHKSRFDPNTHPILKIMKFENMVDSGGEAKYIISDGQVLVNGIVETRKRQKIFSGDVIKFIGKKIRVLVKRD